jgi:hypothetical protein
MLVCLHTLGTAGCGQKWAFLTDPPGLAVHLQRGMTDEERSLLSDEWLEIPARDELGPIIKVEL